MGIESKVVVTFAFLGMFLFLLTNSATNITGINGLEAINNTQPIQEVNRSFKDTDAEENTIIEEFTEQVEHVSDNTYNEGLTKTDSSTTARAIYDVSSIDSVKAYTSEAYLLPGNCGIDLKASFDDGTTETKDACGITRTDTSEIDTLEFIIEDKSYIYELKFTTGEETQIRDYVDLIFNLSSENQFISLVIITPIIVLFSLLLAKVFSPLY